MLLMPFGFLNPYAAAQAAAAAPLLLDTLSCTVAGAYGLRQLRSAYNGPCLRVRRGSDNAEQDIGFSNNLLDTVALLAFCGAGVGAGAAGGDGFASRWYDQSAAAQHVGQAVASNQPRIVAGGALVPLAAASARPALNWSWAAGSAMSGPFAVYAGACAGFSVARAGGNINGSPRLLSFVGTGREDYERGSAIFAGWSSGNGSLFFFEDGSSAASGVAIGDAPFQAGTVFGGASALIAVNGTATDPVAVGAASAALGAGTLRIGLGPGGFAWDGPHAEHIVVAGAVSASDQAAIRASQQTFYGTP